MSEHKCTSVDCVIHTRTDGIKQYSDGEGMAAKVTYVGKYAVLTKINEALEHASAQLLRMFGAPADTFYTMVIEVGEGNSVGDYLTMRSKESYEFLRFMETHTNDGGKGFGREELDQAEKDAEKYHDGIVEAVKADTLDLSSSIDHKQYVEILFNSLKENPAPEGGDGLAGLFG